MFKLKTMLIHVHTMMEHCNTELCQDLKTDADLRATRINKIRIELFYPVSKAYVKPILINYVISKVILPRIWQISYLMTKICNKRGRSPKLHKLLVAPNYYHEEKSS
jgi:hypothetical protein